MKLRIRGNSLRLRLTQREVATIGAGERVAETIAFGAREDERLVYALVPSEEATDVRARLSAGEIAVVVPMEKARAWAGSEEVGFEAAQPLGKGAVLSILVEKDFACLKPRPGDDDADAYPHPGR